MESKYSFYATLTANVFIDDNDFEFICQKCKTHYDSKVRILPEVGGFLYGAKVRRTPYADWIPSDEDRIVVSESEKAFVINASTDITLG